jgi:hypothetical protein
MTTINLKASADKPERQRHQAISPITAPTKLSRNEYYMYKKDLASIESAMEALEELAESVAGLASVFGKRLLMEPNSPLNNEVTQILSMVVNGFRDVHDGLSEAPEVMRPFLARNKPGFLKRLFG